MNAVGIHKLITTRRADWEAPVVVRELNVDEGLALLNSGTRKHGEFGRTLVERLGGLPLAIELARGYLDYKRVKVEDLLRELDQSEVGLWAKFRESYTQGLPSEHDKDIEATFALSWEAAPEEARQVLRVLSEMAPLPVPRDFLDQVIENDDVVTDGLAELRRLSLIETGTDEKPRLHRLIRAYVRWRNQQDGVDVFERVASVMGREMERASLQASNEDMEVVEALVGHAEVVAADDRLDVEDAISLESRVGTHHQAMGRYQASRRAKGKALSSSERHYPPGHSEIAIRKSNLAIVLKELGELVEARDLLRKALASDEKSYPAGHPSIAIRQSNLALVLRELGELEEAQDLLRKAVAAFEKALPQGHPNTKIVRGNLKVVEAEMERKNRAAGA